MPTIRFVKNYPEIQVEPGVNLMDALLSAGFPVASSCHGDGVCGKCRIQIVEGSENLSQAQGLEVILRERLKVPTGYRISCQVQVHGDVVLDTAYW